MCSEKSKISSVYPKDSAGRTNGPENRLATPGRVAVLQDRDGSESEGRGGI